MAERIKSHAMSDGRNTAVIYEFLDRSPECRWVAYNATAMARGDYETDLESAVESIRAFWREEHREYGD